MKRPALGVVGEVGSLSTHSRGKGISGAERYELNVVVGALSGIGVKFDVFGVIGHVGRLDDPRFLMIWSPIALIVTNLSLNDRRCTDPSPIYRWYP